MEKVRRIEDTIKVNNKIFIVIKLFLYANDITV